MITGDLAEWRALVEEPSELLEKGFAAIESLSLDPPSDGRYDVQRDDVSVIVQRYTTKALDEGQFEAHRKYIDIQYVAAGSERMGVLRIAGLAVAENYDKAKDCILYQIPDAGSGLIPLAEGQFALLYPEDAHLPARHPDTGPAEVTKFVAKVLITD